MLEVFNVGLHKKSSHRHPPSEVKERRKEGRKVVNSSRVGIIVLVVDAAWAAVANSDRVSQPALKT